MTRKAFGTHEIPSTRIVKPRNAYPIPGTVPRIGKPMENGMRVQTNLPTHARLPVMPRY